MDRETVIFFDPFPFEIGQKIHINDGPRKGDWEVIGVSEKKVKLRCPVSLREFEWDRFCYFKEDGMDSQVHVCKTCGKGTEKLGHLCDPMEMKEAYICEDCGRAHTDPRHICKPKLQKINFVCIACGRVAQLPSQLCNPRDIELMAKDEPPEKII